MFLFPDGEEIHERVDLTLPSNLVSDSAIGTVSVIGELAISSTNGSCDNSL